MYSSTTEYQRASLTILPTENYNPPSMGQKIPYLSSLLVACHQSSRLYGVVVPFANSLNNDLSVTLRGRSKIGHHKDIMSFPYFCGFSMSSNQYWAWRVYDLCVLLFDGRTRGLSESNFMEKPGIEPVTLGLQDK